MRTSISRWQTGALGGVGVVVLAPPKTQGDHGGGEGALLSEDTKSAD